MADGSHARRSGAVGGWGSSVRCGRSKRGGGGLGGATRSEMRTRNGRNFEISIRRPCQLGFLGDWGCESGVGRYRWGWVYGCGFGAVVGVGVGGVGCTTRWVGGCLF